MTATQESSQEVIDEFVIACHGNRPKVEQMLASDPSLINRRSSLDESPLGAAAHVGNREMAEYLLTQGAEMELAAAAMLGQADEVRRAVDADPSLANSGGAHNIPIIFHAAIGGNFELAQYLAEQGADTGPAVNGSLLHAAVRVSHLAMAAWTLELGADLGALDFENKTAMQRATELGCQEIIELLQSHSGA